MGRDSLTFFYTGFRFHHKHPEIPSGSVPGVGVLRRDSEFGEDGVELPLDKVEKIVFYPKKCKSDGFDFVSLTVLALQKDSKVPDKGAGKK